MGLLTLSANGKSGELLIYDEIGPGWWDEGITHQAVARELREAPELAEITVRINSPGGSVRHGNAIYNELNRHKARVVVEVDSIAASAASVIAMAGDEINLAGNALLMIHEAWGMVQGTASEMETTARVLRKMTEGAADIYAARTGRDKAELLTWMADTTWMSADEALEYGFATKVHANKQKPAEAPKSRWQGDTLLRIAGGDVPDRIRQQLHLAPMREETRPPSLQTPPSGGSQGARPAIVPTALGRLATEARGMRLGNL